MEQETGLVLDMAGNKLPTGSVIMCKLTAFVITEDSDIDYIGGSKIEMVYQADDLYLEFLEQQVKELHMERSQGFITSVFRALTGSICKTRRKQVTGILPTPVTIGSHTPATPIDAPTSKTLTEDVTQAELVVRPPAPASLNEEPVDEPSTDNQLGESYVVDVQHNGKHIPFHCTDAEECKHLTNHFIECLSDKIYNTFKDLFSNVNLNSSQETYPKISIYNKIIMQYVEETNLKYGLD